MQESGEMYLETIYILSEKQSVVRAVDVGNKMGFSKPSVSRAIGILKDGGFIDIDKNGGLTLTKVGRETAKSIYERHVILSECLVSLGVSPETAMEDACRIEHYISEETFNAIKKHMEEYK